MPRRHSSSGSESSSERESLPAAKISAILTSSDGETTSIEALLTDLSSRSPSSPSRSASVSRSSSASSKRARSSRTKSKRPRRGPVTRNQSRASAGKKKLSTSKRQSKTTKKKAAKKSKPAYRQRGRGIPKRKKKSGKSSRSRSSSGSIEATRKRKSAPKRLPKKSILKKKATESMVEVARNSNDMTNLLGNISRIQSTPRSRPHLHSPLADRRRTSTPNELLRKTLVKNALKAYRESRGRTPERSYVSPRPDASGKSPNRSKSRSAREIFGSRNSSRSSSRDCSCFHDSQCSRTSSHKTLQSNSLRNGSIATGKCSCGRCGHGTLPTVLSSRDRSRDNSNSSRKSCRRVLFKDEMNDSERSKRSHSRTPRQIDITCKLKAPIFMRSSQSSRLDPDAQTITVTSGLVLVSSGMSHEERKRAMRRLFEAKPTISNSKEISDDGSSQEDSTQSVRVGEKVIFIQRQSVIKRAPTDRPIQSSDVRHYNKICRAKIAGDNGDGYLYVSSTNSTANVGEVYKKKETITLHFGRKPAANNIGSGSRLAADLFFREENPELTKNTATFSEKITNEAWTFTIDREATVDARGGGWDGHSGIFAEEKRSYDVAMKEADCSTLVFTPTHRNSSESQFYSTRSSRDNVSKGKDCSTKRSCQKEGKGGSERRTVPRRPPRRDYNDQSVDEPAIREKKSKDSEGWMSPGEDDSLLDASSLKESSLSFVSPRARSLSPFRSARSPLRPPGSTPGGVVHSPSNVSISSSLRPLTPSRSPSYTRQNPTIKPATPPISPSSQPPPYRSPIAIDSLFGPSRSEVARRDIHSQLSTPMRPDPILRSSRSLSPLPRPAPRKAKDLRTIRQTKQADRDSSNSMDAESPNDDSELRPLGSVYFENHLNSTGPIEKAANMTAPAAMRSMETSMVVAVDTDGTTNKDKLKTVNKQLQLHAVIQNQPWILSCNFTFLGAAKNLVIEPTRVRFDDRTLWERSQEWKETSDRANTSQATSADQSPKPA